MNPEAYEVAEKLVIAGSFVEHYKYEKPYWVGFPRLLNLGRAKKPKRKPEQEKIRIDNVRRAKQKIRRLVNSNSQLNTFFTITFEKNISDFSFANNEFQKFIKRLKRQFPEFQYLAVPEFQGRGAIHYHLVCNLPYVPVNDITKIWGLGWCFLKRINNIENVGSYISKYLTKEITDSRYFKKKKFFYSFNLNKPLIIDTLSHIQAFFANIPKLFLKEKFAVSIDTYYLGMIQYRQLKLFESLKVDSYLFNVF